MTESKVPITQKSDRLLELLYRLLVKCDLESKQVNDCRIKSMQNLNRTIDMQLRISMEEKCQFYN